MYIGFTIYNSLTETLVIRSVFYLTKDVRTTRGPHRRGVPEK